MASNKRVFLAVSHDVISGALPLPVPTDVVVLQVRDVEHSTAELAEALRDPAVEFSEIERIVKTDPALC